MDDSTKYREYRSDNELIYGYKEFVVDTLADIAFLPKPVAGIPAAGSTCLVLSNSSVYILGIDGHWHEV